MEDTYLTNIKEEELNGDIRVEDTNITNIKDEELDQISIEDI